MNISGAGLSIGQYYSKDLTNIASSVEKAVTGTQYTSVADGPSEKVSLERILGYIKKINSAFSNIQNASSSLQTAQTSYGEIQNFIGAIEEYTQRAASTVIKGFDSRGDMQTKVNELLDKTDRVASKTQYGGIHMLAGDSPMTLSVQVGTERGGTIDVTYTPATTTYLGINGMDITTQASAESALADVQTASDTVAQGLTKIQGSLQIMDYMTTSNGLLEGAAEGHAFSMDSGRTPETLHQVSEDIIQEKAGNAVMYKEANLRVAVNKFFLERTLD